jgi:hypothetical protein
MFFDFGKYFYHPFGPLLTKEGKEGEVNRVCP